MTMARTSLLLWALLAMAALAPPARADGAVFDTAQVIGVEPMLSRIPTRVADTHCETDLADGRHLDGLYGGLDEAIGAEAKRQQHSRCREIRRTVYEEQISGYRVRYRYGESVYERVMSHDPGPTLRVRVSVRPGR
ncbi:MAG: hypothetical protein PVG91_05245 [Gammaproteobacteria bacterium]|jgi:hypothetical protein